MQKPGRLKQFDAKIANVDHAAKFLTSPSPEDEVCFVSPLEVTKEKTNEREHQEPVSKHQSEHKSPKKRKDRGPKVKLKCCCFSLRGSSSPK